VIREWKSAPGFIISALERSAGESMFELDDDKWGSERIFTPRLRSACHSIIQQRVIIQRASTFSAPNQQTLFGSDPFPNDAPLQVLTHLIAEGASFKSVECPIERSANFVAKLEWTKVCAEQTFGHDQHLHGTVDGVWFGLFYYLIKRWYFVKTFCLLSSITIFALQSNFPGEMMFCASYIVTSSI